jgi:hypothetical protein
MMLLAAGCSYPYGDWIQLDSFLCALVTDHHVHSVSTCTRYDLAFARTQTVVQLKGEGGVVHTCNYICQCKLQTPNNCELYNEMRTTNCLRSYDCVKLRLVWIRR